MPRAAVRVARYSIVLAALPLCLLSAGKASATEAGLFAGPIGGSDMRSAYLPPQPGLYVGAIGLGASYSGLEDQFGRQTAVRPAKYDAGLGALLALYVYPWKPFGGSIGTSVSQGYDFISEQIGPRKQSDNGFLDTYSDILIFSKPIHMRGDYRPLPGSPNSRLPYGLTVSAAFSMVFSDGRYKVSDLAVEGHNYNVFIPNAGFSYLTGPRFSLGDGTEISARAFYDIPTKNHANDYQSGRVFDIAWAVTERFGHLQAGLAGNYARQTNADTRNGAIVSPDGNILERATLGPAVTYDLPALHASVKAKVLFDYLDRNTFGDRTTASVSIVFKAL